MHAPFSLCNRLILFRNITTPENCLEFSRPQDDRDSDESSMVVVIMILMLAVVVVEICQTPTPTLPRWVSRATRILYFRGLGGVTGEGLGIEERVVTTLGRRRGQTAAYADFWP